MVNSTHEVNFCQVFNILQESKNKTYRVVELVFILSALYLFLSGLILKHDIHLFSSVCLVIVLGFTLVVIEERKRLGYISVRPQNLDVELNGTTKSFLIKNISEICIYYDTYVGESGTIPRQSIAASKGQNNRIEFETQSDKYSFRIEIEKEHIQQINAIIQYWNSIGLNAYIVNSWRKKSLKINS